MMKKKLIKILLPVLVSGIFAACSKLDESIPQAPDISTHNAGILDRESPNWHGNLVRESSWDLKVCQSCHAADYSGGITGVSCLTCHTQPAGPEACNTCHGDFDNPNIIAPPSDVSGNIETDSVGVGAHMVHLFDNSLGMDIPCETCHVVPQSYFDPGHVDSPLPAEVIFNLLAINNIATNADYDHSSATCSNVYCHGNWEFLKDSSDNQFIYDADKIVGNNNPVIWNNVDGSQALCGTCHDIAPVGHSPRDLTSCGGCHSGIFDSNGSIVDSLSYKHINGMINVFGN